MPENHPVRAALAGALIYVALALAYIVFSGRVAAACADSLDDLRAIEAFKGFGFVATTGTLLFFILLGRWRTTRRQRELLIQSERRAVAAMYAASLAHDLNNMLMGLQGLVEALQGHEARDEYLRTMREATERSLQSLAPFARRLASMAKEFRPGATTAVDLAPVATRIVDLARRHPDVKSCDLRVGEAAAGRVEIQPELLEQAILNLIVNAAQAAGPQGRIELRVRREARTVVLEVHDDGPGVPPEKTDAIFAVGYSTKSKGNGLGLLTVQALAAAGRAQISVARSPLGGAVFRLVFPASAGASAAAEA